MPSNRFERLGRWCARHRWPVVLAWLALVVAAIPFALQAPDALRSGGFIRPDLESAQAKALLEREIGVAEAARRGRVPLRHGCAPASRPSRRPRPPAIAACPGRGVRALGHPAHPLHAAGLARTATPPTTSCSLDLPADDSPEALPGPPGGAAARSPGSRSGSPAALRSMATSRTVSEADLRRSELISLPLAALALLLVFGSVVAAGVPLVVGGAAVVVALAAIFFVAGLTPDEHLRAEPRDAAGAGPGRRLLAADDEPLPRGARRARLGARGRRGRGGRNGADGRPRGVLLRADRAPRPPGPRAVRVHDPAIRRDRRRGRGRRSPSPRR